MRAHSPFLPYSGPTRSTATWATRPDGYAPVPPALARERPRLRRRDQTTQHLLVAGVVVPSDLDTVRGTLRGLVLPGQRRLHIKDENDQRRRAIVAAIVASGVSATI